MSDETLIVDGDDTTEQPAGSPPPAADTTEPQLDELAKVTAERDEYLDTLRRVQAEFENFRKRVRREQEGEHGRAVAAVVERLLPVLDAFDGARDHHPDVLDPVDRVLQSALSALDVERVGADGEPFDPSIHDAVGHDAGEAGGGESVVVEVLRPGYRAAGRLLRPAMVRVGTQADGRAVGSGEG